MHSRPVDHPCPFSRTTEAWQHGGSHWSEHDGTYLLNLVTNTRFFHKAAYLDRRNTSYGFQPTAMVHSLPQVAFVWASFLFTIQGFWSTLGDLPVTLLLHATIPIATVLVMACYGIWVALHPRERSFRDVSLPEPAPFLDSPTDQKLPLTANYMV
jgi:hypothetical protein